MCKLKNQSEEVFVLAFGYARYAFQRYRMMFTAFCPERKPKDTSDTEPLRRNCSLPIIGKLIGFFGKQNT